MEGILVAHRNPESLAPLTERTCLALLPVLGKPVAVHALESMVTAGIRKIWVSVAAHADQVEQELGDGRRWGVELDYILTQGGEPVEEILRRVRPRLADDALLVTADTIRSNCIPEFLECAAATDLADASVVSAVHQGAALGIQLVRTSTGGDGQATAEVPDAGPSLTIDSLVTFHQANLDAAAGRFSGLLIPGREVSPGVIAGRQTRIGAKTVKNGPVFVGSRCEVKPEAELLGSVVLSDDVVIDRRATLKSAVILPHSYVGEMVEVSDAIVWTNDLIDIQSGVVTRVTDAFLLADLGSAVVGSKIADLLNRGLGAVLLVASLPLWPIALLASLISSPGSPFRRIRLLGNQVDLGLDGRSNPRAFDAFEAATQIPILRKLPLLLAVVRGDLRLVGVTTLSPDIADNRTEDWERLRDDAPAGLIGPAQLSLADNAPEEERWLLEAYYARTRTTRSDLGWLARGFLALFTRRAWSAGSTPETSAA